MKTELTINLYKSKIDLSDATRQKSIDVLNTALATGLDIYTQTKQAHWNVKGKDFYQLHLLFDDIASVLFDPIDLMAERITALGGIALGTAKDASENSVLPDYPSTEGMSEIDHLHAISDRLALFGKLLREGMNKTDAWNDQTTNDIFTQISRNVDQKLWFVEAHLQSAQ
ncbi:MAG: DNA starvation/stationary phase protection protein Dps [Candidatus Obscuribacterales bacterium]|nr:DNA starvation/stationary phase protection protein Dps [Candidatus Obscuribacterales bacterium]